MSNDDCMFKFTGQFNWPQIIQNAKIETSNYTTVYDYQLEVGVTTLSHDLVRKTTIIYPFHFQVVRTAQLTIIYPVTPEPTREPTFEPTNNPTVERNFFFFFERETPSPPPRKFLLKLSYISVQKKVKRF